MENKARNQCLEPNRNRTRAWFSEYTHLNTFNLNGDGVSLWTFTAGDLSCTTVNAVNRLRVGLEVSCRLSVRRGSSSGGGGAKPARSMLQGQGPPACLLMCPGEHGRSGGSTQGHSSPHC